MTSNSWPRVDATFTDHGADVSLDGALRHIDAATIEDARREVVEMLAADARRMHGPLRVLTHEPSGSWPIIIFPDGHVEVDEAPQSPEPAHGETPRFSVPAETPGPITHVPPEPAAQQPPAAQPAGSYPAGPRRGDYSDELQVSPVAAERHSFLTSQDREEPARHGWRGMLSRVGIHAKPSEAERHEREDVRTVSQHWPGPRTIAVVNGKGGAGKTPTTVCLSSVFARYGGAGVLAWDNNQTRGTLGWRTEKGPHDATLLELLPEAERLLGTGAQSADLARFVHHQPQDRFDVLRSKPMALASAQRIDGNDVDTIHEVAAKYYRLIIIDSGNDESDPMWLRMIDHADQIVIATTTRDDHAEAGALLLEALQSRDEHSRHLAHNAVVVVNQADPKATRQEITDVTNGYANLAREVVNVPFDAGMINGILHYAALRPKTQRAWLAAAAAVARGL